MASDVALGAPPLLFIVQMSANAVLAALVVKKLIAQARLPLNPVLRHAPHGLRIISPLTLTLVFSEPSGRLQKFGPEFFLPSAHRRFGLCPCAPSLVSSSSPSYRCLHLGMSFSSLSFSPRLKFAYF